MTSKKIPKKRGKLSIDEERYIRENVSELSIEQIADAINRTAKPVERFIIENNLGVSTLTDQQNNRTLITKLHSKTFWSEIVRQFDETTGELEYFENTWIGLIKQFREDVLPAEEMQIKQFITIDILINRSMKERKRHIQETERLQREVETEYKLPEDVRDIPKLANLENWLRTFDFDLTDSKLCVDSCR